MLVLYSLKGCAHRVEKDKVINTAWNISNPQDTAPVMAKWFGESGQIEYVISQKKTPGTRISIPVKPSYAPYIDLDFIVETIKHYMLTLPIPVNIRCDTKEVCLSQPKAKWNYPMNELVGMNIIRVDNSLLEGYVAIYHPKHKGYFISPRCTSRESLCQMLQTYWGLHHHG